MKDLFNFDTNDFIATSKKGDYKLIKKTRKQVLKYSKRDDKCEEILLKKGGFPKTNEFYALKTSGETDAGSFFTYALKAWESIDEMFLATWTISRFNVKRISDALESGQLKKLTFVISNTMKPANPSLYNHLVLSLKKFDNCTIKEAPSHAKTYSMSDGNGNFITVSGSANWSENPRIENYLIFNDEELYNHHSEWMKEISNGN